MTRGRFSGRETHVSARAARLGFAGSDLPDPTSDLGELLGRVARGDEAAFAAVYDALASAVHGLARRVIRDPARAEEISQEVFIQVWQTAVRFDPQRGSAKSWVLTLAHRRAVD